PIKTYQGKQTQLYISLLSFYYRNFRVQGFKVDVFTMDNSSTMEQQYCDTGHTGDRCCSGEEPQSGSVATDIHMLFEKVTHKRPSIYKVPEHLRTLNENAYTPWHVSIGPYHHKSHKYRVMEEQKLVYMESLILRSRRGRNKATNTNFQEVTKEEIDEYVKELEKLEAEARSCYAEKVELNKEEFVKMLLIDGCFVVEFLCRKLRKLAKFEDEAIPYFEKMYAFIINTYKRLNLSQDFILKSSRTAFEVRRDLTLLENQLPYFVLETLFDFTFKSESSSNSNIPNFRTIVYCGLRTSIPNITHILTEDEIIKRIEIEPEATAHFVSLLKSYCGPVLVKGEGIGSPFSIQGNRDDDQRVVPMYTGELSEFPCLCNMKTHEIRVPCAARLAKSGVLFQKMGGEEPLLQMSFDEKNGVLKMPVLILWHHTESYFRNIMAYELYNHTANYSQNVSVSDYMCFMDDLINSKEDVAVLVKSGILQNWLESDDVVADLFNSITKHILADYSSYSYICKQMNQFRKKYNIRQLKAVLRQDYFNQPWAIIYFITAVVIQTAASIIETVSNINENRGK
ncbi:hypothetical protein RDABS01_024912, partial [Bienertia sinuspersici]